MNKNNSDETIAAHEGKWRVKTLGQANLIASRLRMSRKLIKYKNLCLQKLSNKYIYNETSSSQHKI